MSDAPYGSRQYPGQEAEGQVTPRLVPPPSGDLTRWRSYDMRIVAGKGTAGTKTPWDSAKRDEIRALTGIDALPASLNLRSMERVWLRRRAGVRWSQGLLFAGRIHGVAVAFTKVAKLGASPRLVHVYADRHLKTELSVSDGDLVTLQIPSDVIASMPLMHELVYWLRLLRSRVWLAVRGLVSSFARLTTHKISRFRS
jgi:hypothetical protein